MFLGILELFFLMVVFPVSLSLLAAALVFKFVDYFNYRMKVAEEAAGLVEEVASVLTPVPNLAHKK